MTEILLVVVVGCVVVACFKAYYNAKLAEKNPEAFERLRRVEEEKNRRRQEVLGTALLAGGRTVWGWIKGKAEKKEEKP